MMAKRKSTIPTVPSEPRQLPPLSWLRAEYLFHTFAYRDPRAAFASATGLPVVSPTAVVLGIASTLFSCGRAKEALDFLKIADVCQVVVDAPIGMIFFWAFHQLRRYETGQMKVKKEKFQPNPRVGLTKINQGRREYGLPEGTVTVFAGIPVEHLDVAIFALTNLDHFGTHDSLCSLVGHVDVCNEPTDVVYLPPEAWRLDIPPGATFVSLSRFKKELVPDMDHWFLAGGDDTEIVQFAIKGRFEGTTNGKIYRKG